MEVSKISVVLSFLQMLTIYELSLYTLNINCIKIFAFLFIVGVRCMTKYFMFFEKRQT